MTRPDVVSRPALPKWLVAVICAALAIIVAVVVAILVIVVNSTNATAQREAAATAQREAAATASAKAEEARLGRLKQLRIAVLVCGVDPSTITNGGRKFEATSDIGSKVMPRDVECILTKLKAPPSVLSLPSRVFAGDPPKSAGWGDFTYTIDYPKFLGPSTKTIEFTGD